MSFAGFYVVHLVEVSLTKGLRSSRSEHGLYCRRWSRKKKYSEVVIECGGGTVAVAECAHGRDSGSLSVFAKTPRGSKFLNTASFARVFLVATHLPLRQHVGATGSDQLTLLCCSSPLAQDCTWPSGTCIACSLCS